MSVKTAYVRGADPFHGPKDNTLYLYSPIPASYSQLSLYLPWGWRVEALFKDKAWPWWLNVETCAAKEILGEES